MRIVTAAALLVVGPLAMAQSPVDHIAFDRPESWALQYFGAVTTFSTTGPCGVNCTRFVYVTPGMSSVGALSCASAFGTQKSARSRKIQRLRRTTRAQRTRKA